ncbi:MAG: hypothetical protein B6D61_13015 [Bacteroidetes bacterium 4484_249]|nr:MAG: hypothetical protein B6D61_13015 [Bacteroidetes bacterium 4484_249]
MYLVKEIKSIRLTKYYSKKLWNLSRDKVLRNMFNVRTLPSLLIIGAQKAGTNSLFYYLNQHPQLQGAYEKEVRFFSSVEYNKGLKYYEKQFPTSIKNNLFFEATPEYLYYSWAAQRIFEFNKEIKLIVLLRDPVERAYSAWNMFREIHGSKGKYSIIKKIIKKIENKESVEAFTELLLASSYPDFSDYIVDECEKIKNNNNLWEPSFVRRGIYVEQLKRLYDLFDKEQILIFESKELKNNKINTLNKITSFLNIDRYDYQITDLQNVDKRNYNRKIAKEEEDYLRNFYKPYNNELYKLIGREFDW